MRGYSKKQLLINYLLGICTHQERKEIEEWLAEDEHNVQVLLTIAGELNDEQPLTRVDKNDIKRNIAANIVKNSTVNSSNSKEKYNPNQLKAKQLSSKSQKTLFNKRKFWYQAVAVILVAVTASIGVFWYHGTRPGMKNTVWLQQTVPYGQTATLRLSDGSVVTLHGGSTLRYPKKFSNDKREVYLEGEAFFSISPDTSHLFVVHAGSITTHVLGTAFNIEAYENGNHIQVSVAEGRVAVTTADNEKLMKSASKRVLLGKNQWATYQPSGQLTGQGEGSIWEMIAWKENILIFNDKSLAEVVRMLERWYGVKVVLKNKELKHLILSGKHNDASLKSVLESIQFALGIEYTMEQDVVTIQSPHN